MSASTAPAFTERLALARAVAGAVGLLLFALAGPPARAAELTIDEGVVVKFGAGAQLAVRDRLVQGAGVVFTSQRDDSIGGQAGPAPQSPAAGDWRGLRIEKTASAFGSVSLTDLTLRFAGAGPGGPSGAGLTVRGVGNSLRFVQVSDSRGSGILLIDTPAAQMEGIRLLRNEVGLQTQSSPANVTGSSIAGSGAFGVQNLTPAVAVAAPSNWWGDATGPKDAAGNPAGRGDAVSAGVSYAAFLSSAPLINPTVRLAAPLPFFDVRTVQLDVAAAGATEYRVAEAGAFGDRPFLALPEGRAQVAFTVSEGDGRREIEVQFRNAEGASAAASLQGGVLYDILPPSLAVQRPADGEVLNEPSSVDATASDGSGIARVDFYLDNQLQGSLTRPPFALAWNPALVSEGGHIWRVVATDGVGRQAQVSRSVTVSRTAPGDRAGPTLSNITFGGATLADGTRLTRSGTVVLSATDRSGVARVELLLDGAVVAAGSFQGADSYSAALSLAGVAAGNRVLAVRATDSLGNTTTLAFNVVVAPAPPPAPVITQPQSGATTRETAIAVAGTATPGATVQLLVGGQPSGAATTANATGEFRGTAALVAGVNTLQATAADAFGTSAPSAAISVTVDLSVPSSPGTLAATSLAQGLVRLSWARTLDPNAVGYNVYRSSTAFADVASATRINAGAAQAATSYDDLPPGEGTWFYRVVAVNASGTASLPSNQAQAVADSIAPRAVSIAYSTSGKTDAATGRMGQGQLSIVLTVSEQLQAAPYLAIVPAGDAPIPVNLTSSNATTYNGSFTIDANVPSGTASILFSARDRVGNLGTEIGSGATLKIETDGPALTGIVVNPASPIKNDPPPSIQGTFTFSKAPKSAPQISYLLSGPLRAPVPIGGLTATSPTTWQASFRLPADAGLGSPETLVFKSQASDDLDNVSTKVLVTTQIQVYQGRLPPLGVPASFSAKAQPGGKVLLAWQAVEGASAYQILRQGPGQTTLQPLVRTTGTSYIDQAPADGVYRYAVASVRTGNGEEALSSESLVVEVRASASAPGAPQALTLVLGGQGIFAQWQPPPGGNVASYNLYRGAGTSITSVQGLTPLRTGITAAAALDATPVANQSAYVVTALDSAGNESAPSNSAYLNVSLLPVTNVRVELVEGQAPVLSWAAPNSGVSGYVVDVGPANAKTRLTPSPISALSITDTGYAGGDRRYTISSVDGQAIEMPRTVVLPSMATQVASGLPLKRGIMNRLKVQVVNLSSASLAGVRAVVRVPINQEATQFKEHRSEPFSLGSNQTLLADVIVGGYAEMPSGATLQVGVEISPQEGELVKVTRTQRLEVIEGSLVVGMATQQFTRGGTGQVRLSIENTTDVEVELLTAAQNGSADSGELRFKLLSNEGNVLAAQAFRQAEGAGIVTLPNGLSVARIPAGSTYTSEVFSINVPSASPGSVRVRLEVDKLRYRSGQADELIITGRGSERTVTLVDTAYTGEVTDITPLVSFGDEDVTIRGRAVDRASGQALSNARLKLVLNQEGFERTFAVVTDGSGSFTHVFKPTLTDAGQYRVSALHPDVTDRPEQKSFSINRVAVGPTPYKLDVPRTVPFSIPFLARSGPGTSATGLRFSLDAAAQPTGQLPLDVTLQLPAPVTLGERQTANMPVTFTAGSQAQPSGNLVLNVLSNERGSTPVGQVRVDYTLSEARPFLVSTPSLVETGLGQGSSQIESIVVQNNGLQDAVNLRFSLSKPDGSAAPAWVTVASRSDGTLAVAERRSVDLSFAPPAGTPEGIYEFRLDMQGDNLPRQSVRVFVSLTQSGRGDVLFKASDIYTATVDRQGFLIPGLAGATIVIQNEDVPTISLELVTDSNGEAAFRNLPAGRYKFRARARNHQDASGRLTVRPGVTLSQPVFLEYTVVTVEWSVREITIQDRYEVTLNATFETDVPAPVIVMQPASINLPKMNTGDVFYGELSITNFGLVRADNFKQILPAPDPFFRYEFLGEVPPTLEAKQRITLPYRVIALQSLEQAASASSSSGGGCYAYQASTRTTCSYQCANGVLSEACGSSTTWYLVSNSSCPPGGGGGSSGGSGGGGLGGGPGNVGWNSWIGGGVGGPSTPGTPSPVSPAPLPTPLPNAPRCQANPRDCQ